ncbi:hypothetical protein DSM106972_062430 [Dulcicalothrix desertica PCC 7102]|uniref:Uncharacterized protein n=1 Tax=Dulcicalothrix desertica PCC 7102 TaxID=232991 RepID=A0A433V7Z3_9CYAN|nr:hypothetical protein DSM106972_062430 [Dulcicalothrix desertica PCC 7102]
MFILFKGNRKQRANCFLLAINTLYILLVENLIKISTFKISSFYHLPDVLIKARIAAKMSQKELADILDIEEERIKECESKDYQCASFI